MRNGVNGPCAPRTISLRDVVETISMHIWPIKWAVHADEQLSTLSFTDNPGTNSLSPDRRKAFLSGSPDQKPEIGCTRKSALPPNALPRAPFRLNTQITSTVSRKVRRTLHHTKRFTPTFIHWLVGCCYSSVLYLPRRVCDPNDDMVALGGQPVPILSAQPRIVQIVLCIIVKRVGQTDDTEKHYIQVQIFF